MGLLRRLAAFIAPEPGAHAAPRNGHRVAALLLAAGLVLLAVAYLAW